MKTDNIFLKFILPIFACFLSLAGVVIGSVALAFVCNKTEEEPRIYDVRYLGINDFYKYEATELFIDFESYPEESGYYNDKEVVDKVTESLRETLKDAVFMPAKEPPTWFGSQPFIILTVNKRKFGFSVADGAKLAITCDKSVSYYYTGCCNRINEIIYDTFTELTGIQFEDNF